MPLIHEQVESAASLISAAENIVAFTGAGISTESGLADFRSPGGLWDRYRIVTFPEFMRSHDARVEYWTMRRELIPTMLRAKPNPAHEALAELEKRHKLSTVITQNIDGLHQDAGCKKVVELHGTNRTASCLSCGKRWAIAEIQTWLEGDELDPHCDECDGLIKPETVSFGQSMPSAAVDAAYEAAEQSDLMLMIGSSLEVQPAASVPMVAHQAGAKLLFINKTETDYDGLADLLVRDAAGKFMTAALEELDSYE